MKFTSIFFKASVSIGQQKVPLGSNKSASHGMHKKKKEYCFNKYETTYVCTNIIEGNSYSRLSKKKE